MASSKELVKANLDNETYVLFDKPGSSRGSNAWDNFKVLHLAEMDQVTVRFLRQVLLGLLLHDTEDAVQEVFQRVAVSSKLHLFREGIRLFIHHFLLRNMNSLPQESVKVLQQRANMADKILSAAESKIKF